MQAQLVINLGSVMRWFFIVFVAVVFTSCTRYDYYPRGIHEYIEKIPDVNQSSAKHVVKKGETLVLIARTYGLSYQDIARRNNIRKPYIIFVGQKLILRRVDEAAAVKKPGPKASGNTRIQLIWPVKGKLSSKFGPRKNRMHDGIDIAAKVGTKIVSAAYGEVVYADNKLTGYGNLIIVRHNSDMFTAYAHNQKNLVKAGERVNQGQQIATVGKTGRATGAHLHFEVRRGELAVNPMPYLP